MKTFVSIIGALIVVFGGGMLTYDILFIRRYGFDMNEVLASDGPWVIDWETGERPAYAYYPAWMWAFILLAIGLVLFLTPQLMKKQRGRVTA